MRDRRVALCLPGDDQDHGSGHYARQRHTRWSTDERMYDMMAETQDINSKYDTAVAGELEMSKVHEQAG